MKIGDMTDEEFERFAGEAAAKAASVFGKKKMSISAHNQRKAAAQAHWNGRGKSMTIRVDEDAARALLVVPMKDRRTVATKGVKAAVSEYFATGKK